MEKKVGQSQIIDIPKFITGCTEKWTNVTLSEVNSSLIRLGVIEGEFHWHTHKREDEFFYVVDGMLYLDIENRGTIELVPKQGYTVPKGVLHRTRAKSRTVILMVEQNTVQPKGD